MLDDENQQQYLEQQLGRIAALVDQAKQRSKSILCYLNTFLLFFTIQLGLVSYVLYQGNLTKLASQYLWICSIQYSFHIYLIFRLRYSNLQILKQLQLEPHTQTYGMNLVLEYFGAHNQQPDIWRHVVEESPKLLVINQSFYIVMFIIGNVVFFSNQSELPSWLFCIQLMIGWIFLSLTTILITLACVILPIIIIFEIYKQRRQQLRRQNIAQSLRERVQKYNQGQNDTENQRIQKECHICQQEFQPDDDVLVLNCHPTHIFHWECLNPWLEIRDSCPVCRAPVI
ncbi:hypothetical protein pb186bvf_007068 [Paramecium bursaria]